MTDELSLDRLNQVSGGMSLSDQIAAINSQKALAAAKYNHAMDAAFTISIATPPGALKQATAFLGF